MFTGFADQPAHVAALSPLQLLHVGELVQLELRVDDDVLLVRLEFSGGSGIPAVASKPQGEQALQVMPSEAGADAHHPEPQLEGTEIVSEGSLDPQLRLHLGIPRILFKQDLEAS